MKRGLYMGKKIFNLPKTNGIVRWFLISSLFIVCVTLIAGWLLWFNINAAHDTLNKFLNFLQTDLFHLGFWGFSIIIFVFAGLALLLALPLIFIKQKNTTSNIFSLLSLILTAGILGFGLYANIYLIKFKHFSLNGNLSLFAKENLIVVIPFYIAMLFALIGIITSFINLVAVFKGRIEIKETKKIPTPNLINNTVKTNNAPIIPNANINLNNGLTLVPKTENKIEISNNNQTTPKTLATIRVIVPAGNIKDAKTITDNIRVYQNQENVNLDFNISE